MINIIIDNQIFEIKWSKSNIEWYKNKGYEFTNYSDKFMVKAEDLSKGSHNKVDVRCDYCGKVVRVAWKDYVKYKDAKYACQKCRQKKTSEKNLSKRQESLYSRALKFCNDNNYTLLDNKESIKNSGTRVKYVCPIHGMHESKVYSLIMGRGCIECGHDATVSSQKLSADYVENEIAKYGGILLNKEDYSNCLCKNLRVVCPGCGNVFATSYNSFVKHDGQRCLECSNTISRGEYAVKCFLDDNNIGYFTQYRFDDCRYKNTLPFDFYVPSLNTVIEFDGAQHFMPVNYGGISKDKLDLTFELTKKRDAIKDEYCKNNNINIIRIPYWDKDRIDEILKEKLNPHNDIV